MRPKIHVNKPVYLCLLLHQNPFLSLLKGMRKKKTLSERPVDHHRKMYSTFELFFEMKIKKNVIVHYSLVFSASFTIAGRCCVIEWKEVSLRVPDKLMKYVKAAA